MDLWGQTARAWTLGQRGPCDDCEDLNVVLFNRRLIDNNHTGKHNGNPSLRYAIIRAPLHQHRDNRCCIWSTVCTGHFARCHPFIDHNLRGSTSTYREQGIIRELNNLTKFNCCQMTHCENIGHVLTPKGCTQRHSTQDQQGCEKFSKGTESLRQEAADMK